MCCHQTWQLVALVFLELTCKSTQWLCRVHFSDTVFSATISAIIHTVALETFAATYREATKWHTTSLTPELKISKNDCQLKKKACAVCNLADNRLS